ncbi:MAG: glycosyltransferase, partial [Caldilineaceae bacterium]|nr:glycosyltransferase [Caldilineaceae bacterium]
RTEGLGKLLNYMAMGLPTVAFDVPVAREYLGNLGVYAETGSAAGLAECICRLLERHRRDPDGLRELRCQLRERAREQFGWQPVGQALNRLYAEILGGS